MASEPLTVDELERPIPHWAIGLARKLRAYLQEMESQPPSYAARVEGMARIITEHQESHSRQLWLEAAPLEELQLLEDALFIAASRVAPEKRKMLMLDLGERVFQQKKARAKAESTPKPSPALPREEKL